ncbi:hypothetical protein LCGC14_2281140, partial [marine sediment metagenome]
MTPIELVDMQRRQDELRDECVRHGV